MPRSETNGLINAVAQFKMQERQLGRKVGKAMKTEKKVHGELIKLMNGGDESLINDQAILLGTIRAQIKETRRMKINLQQFTVKVETAIHQTDIGVGMAAVARALGSVTERLKLDKFEQTMTDLSRQYDDIDVMTSVMETSTSKATAKTVTQEEVDLIKRQVADEAGVELRQQLSSVEPVSAAPTKADQPNEEELNENLKNLRTEAAT